MNHFVKISFFYVLLKLSSILKDIFFIKYVGNTTEFNDFIFLFEIVMAIGSLLCSPFSAIIVPSILSRNINESAVALKTSLCAVLSISVVFFILKIFNFIDVSNLILAVLVMVIFRGFLESILLCSSKQMWIIALQAITPVVFVLFYLLFKSFQLSFLLAYFVEVLVTFAVTTFNSGRKKLLLRVLILSCRGAKSYSKDYIYLVGASLSSIFLIAIDQSMIRFLSPNSNVLYAYGCKISILLITAGVTVFSMILLPSFTEIYQGRGLEDLRSSVRKWLLLILLFGFSLVPVCYYSDFILRLLYGSNNIANESFVIIVSVNDFFLLQVPFSVASIILIRYFNVVKLNSIFWKVGIFLVPLNIGLNYVLFRHLEVSGIALSTSILQILSFSILFLSFMFYRENDSGSKLTR